MATADQINSNEDNFQTFQLDINSLKIEGGRHYFILGKTGSGKSSLLYAILNEMNVFPNNLKVEENGKTEPINFFLNGSIGLVSQNSWLQDETIRVNTIYEYLN